MRTLILPLLLAVALVGCKEGANTSASDRSGGEAMTPPPSTPTSPPSHDMSGSATATTPPPTETAATVDAGMPATDAGAATEAPKPPAQELYATFDTTQGKFVVKLFPVDAPKTVQNFVELATGKREWTDPRTGKKSKEPLYNGTIFHRVIPGFMIQGGDPLGQGFGGPGYQFEDEFQSGRTFDKPGILAMANAGPNTNGSQFFVTVSTPTHLNNHHTIFGEVVKGYDVVEAISKVPTARGDKPIKEVKITKITITEKAP